MQGWVCLQIHRVGPSALLRAIVHGFGPNSEVVGPMFNPSVSRFLRIRPHGKFSNSSFTGLVRSGWRQDLRLGLFKREERRPIEMDSSTADV
jgi:hypothetical protein